MGIRIERNFPIMHNDATDFCDTIECTVIAEGDHSECSPEYTVKFQHPLIGDASINVDYVIQDESTILLPCGYKFKTCDIQRIAQEMNFARIMFEVGFNMQ